MSTLKIPTNNFNIKIVFISLKDKNIGKAEGLVRK